MIKTYIYRCAARLGRTILPVALFFSLPATGGNSGQQEENVVFPERNITVKAAFDAIVKQTKYMISFNNSYFDTSRRVTLSSPTLPLRTAMDELTAASGNSYNIQGRYILIVHAESAEIPSSAQKQKVYGGTPAIFRLPATAPSEQAAETDSLELALQAKVDLPAVIVPEPRFSQSPLYKWKRPDWGAVAGTFSYRASFPIVALRTNLLYGAGALTPNLGIELGLSSKSSLLAAGSYNGWNGSGNRKLNHWTVTAEYRRWFGGVFGGHFVGAHGFYGFYNIAGRKIPLVLERGSQAYRYRGHAAGAGVSYGYHLTLGGRWGAEFNAGIGVGVLNYDKYRCTRCGERVESDVWRVFAAPKLGVSLVYVIKRSPAPPERAARDVRMKKRP